MRRIIRFFIVILCLLLIGCGSNSNETFIKNELSTGPEEELQVLEATQENEQLETEAVIVEYSDNEKTATVFLKISDGEYYQTHSALDWHPGDELVYTDVVIESRDNRYETTADKIFGTLYYFEDVVLGEYTISCEGWELQDNHFIINESDLDEDGNYLLNVEAFRVNE